MRRRDTRQTRSRTDRRQRVQGHRRSWLIPLVAILGVLAVIGGVALAVAWVGPPGAPVSAVAKDTPLPDRPLSTEDGSATAEAEAELTSAASTAPLTVEVPDVTGKSIAVAEALLKAAGFRIQTRVADVAVSGAAPDTVVTQFPAPRTMGQAGDRVILTYQPANAVPAGPQKVVVIDPGHQATGDSSPEPIGPGSRTTKAKVAYGATGIATHIPEYKQTLAIALKLRDRLEAAGVKVVMVRTSHAVNISNAERARIGNRAKADLVVRVHLDGSNKPKVQGISALYPSGNAWCAPIEAESKRAAALVLNATIKATGAQRRGLFPRGDMTGFNWSTRPTIIMECGFLSNPDEDRRIANPEYQDRIASGISAGVLSYLGR